MTPIPAVGPEPGEDAHHARTEQDPLARVYFAFPGIGHVAKEGDGFRYYPEGMDMQM
jgi:hypothetical protein